MEQALQQGIHVTGGPVIPQSGVVRRPLIETFVLIAGVHIFVRAGGRDHEPEPHLELVIQPGVIVCWCFLFQITFRC